MEEVRGKAHLVYLAMVGHLFSGEEGVPAVWAEKGARARVHILMVAQVALADEPLGAAGLGTAVGQPDVNGPLVVGQTLTRDKNPQTGDADVLLTAAAMLESHVSL